MTTTTYRGVDVPGVRPPAGGFVHATVVSAGSDLVFVSGQIEVVAARPVTVERQS